MSPSNLPVQWTSFVGRKQELADLEGILAESRLVTLTGAGRTGKTRLALQVVSARESYYPDGVWLINLTSTRDPALIPQTITQALGLHLAADQPMTEQLLQWIKPKHGLPFIDSVQQKNALAGRFSVKNCPEPGRSPAWSQAGHRLFAILPPLQSESR